MDTTKKYIKMCEKAKEIQEKKTKQDLGDKYLMWLPRQDQLQEMLADLPTDYSTEELVEEFAIYVANELNSSIWSMEQLWLAFVMKEKYGKIWDEEKEEWIK